MLTGAQTAKRRKTGSRITAAGTFLGSGQALNADEDEKTTGTGFRKKAVSKRAREERALAAQKRQLALEGKIFLQLHRKLRWALSNSLHKPHKWTGRGQLRYRNTRSA